MKKMIVLIAAAVLAFPVIASADLIGDCYDCHTMHASEQNALPIDMTSGPNANLLRYSCLECHAQNPTGGTKNWTGFGGSVIPQVAHADPTGDLSGGNFTNPARAVHSIVDVTAAGISPAVPLGETVNDTAPGIPHSSNRHAFTTDTAANAYDAFTCAGARGCHGTRAQILTGATVDNGTDNVWTIGSRRTGIAAISGSHHANMDGEWKTDAGYTTPAVHDGAIVAEGYRFIQGLWGYENNAREYISGTDRNEYYGDPAADFSAGCSACHLQGFGEGDNQRASFTSNINTVNNTMSGFCSSCHGYFHSSGGVGIDATNNGVSGAFLRHPSDYVIPATGEYAAYTVFDPTAPIAKTSTGAAPSATVVPGVDAVGCLSCHVAHGSANDYLLRFDYTTMTAGFYGDVPTAQGAGGCLACHTEKGVLPVNR